MQLPRRKSGSPAGYREIFAWVAAEIRDGRLGPGDRLPTEAELGRHFKVSRMTVSRALSDLTGLRLITRRRGAGTFVAESGGTVPLFAARDVAEELRATRDGFAVVVLAHGADVWPRMITPDPRAERCVHSLLVYAASEGPVQLEERWVNPAEVPAYAKADLRRTSSFSLLASVRADQIETTLTAARPTRSDARLLECGTGQPCWILERTAWRSHLLVSHSRIVSRGDRYSLHDRVTR